MDAEFLFTAIDCLEPNTAGGVFRGFVYRKQVSVSPSLQFYIPARLKVSLHTVPQGGEVGRPGGRIFSSRKLWPKGWRLIDQTFACDLMLRS
jgi:hypothetical protein